MANDLAITLTNARRLRRTVGGESTRHWRFCAPVLHEGVEAHVTSSARKISLQEIDGGMRFGLGLAI